jgi:hypothetical protein
VKQKIRKTIRKKIKTSSPPSIPLSIFDGEGETRTIVRERVRFS